MGVRIALLVLSGFAVAWSWAALRFSGAAMGLIVVPIAISLALTLAGWRDAGAVPARGSRVGRLVALWTGIEFATLFFVANVFATLHQLNLMFPAAAAIVGLHFFPLARGIPVRAYYATGTGLLAIALIGLLLPADQRPVVVGLGAALILWATVGTIIVTARQAAAPAA
jgi:hypothetical protein